MSCSSLLRIYMFRLRLLKPWPKQKGIDQVLSESDLTHNE